MTAFSLEPLAVRPILHTGQGQFLVTLPGPLLELDSACLVGSLQVLLDKPKHLEEPLSDLILERTEEESSGSCRHEGWHRDACSADALSAICSLVLPSHKA